MNIFFLSLLEPNLNRRKNVANVYWVENYDDFDLKTRFPFLEVGDLIRKKNHPIFMWNGNRICGCHILFIFQFHPFFLGYEVDQDNNWEVILPFKVKNVIKFSLLERRNELGTQKYNHIFIPKIKIRKVKYDLIITLGCIGRMNKGLFDTLDELIRETDQFSCFTKWDQEENLVEDYMARTKKRLFLVYEED